MFTPLMEMGAWVHSHLPSMPTDWSFRRPHFNFITLHYLYLILMTILGSILLYPAGGMDYIDALFFASGAATQSGLNTIDVNKLYLYQQVVLMLIACVCNPIFINTFVVFVRLYWFEKRFQGLVAESRNRNRTRSRTRSEAKGERDIGHEEQGVNGRAITVVRNQDGHAQGAPCNIDGEIEEEKDQFDSTAETATAIGADSTTGQNDTIQPFHRDITFADDVKPPPRRSIAAEERLPIRRPAEQHIAFVENQRRPKTKTRLRIPGPREFDRGDKPQSLEEEDGAVHLARELTNESSMRGRDEANQPADTVDPGNPNEDDQAFKRQVSADEHVASVGGRLRSGFNNVRRRMTLGEDHDNEDSGIRRRASTFRTFVTARSRERELDPAPYLSWQPTIGRNSAFVDLTEEQREELGGIEYRALKTLAFILVFYFVGFHLLGMIVHLPWIVRSSYNGSVLKPDGISAVWWGFFTPASMFNDLGFTLTPDSMVSFQKAVLPMLFGSFLIIIGNTGFPCMLRLVIWLAEKLVPYGSGVWEELRFLLDHPRRCFTLLFPSKATWWLFWVLVLLNGIDLIFFVILDINDETVTSLTPGYRVLDGLFQAASTRTAGFACVNIADLHPAVQVSYLIMMYISVFPIAISLRRTNVYEEKSLGLYSEHSAPDEAEQSYVGTHLRRQLSFDLWYIFLGFFFIAIIEGSRLENTNDFSFTLFSVLFEIVSAYGTVGLSLGYPNINASFSAEFKTLSKLIIIAMQIRGRHRGLPYALDRAILLPSETLHKKEDDDAGRRAAIARRNSNLSEMERIDPTAFAGRPPTFRRGSVATARDEEGPTGNQWLSNQRRSASAAGLTKLLSGALSAGPSIHKRD
ncbi:Cation transporter [Lasiodiplodia theobromae]|uniref:Cation transporter n=1 Tax=Lasiodiplodia theobromae TaxID=45133 RepID=UPI0015C2FA9F|nr:Cation transporter [Lasiodiplodia theobromae]KAF4544113.1 Cation transporter [Lasiodiplodia theobromae]